MSSETTAIAAIDHVKSVAMIDDAFIRFTWDQAPESHRDKLAAALRNAEVITELDTRGYDVGTIDTAPGDALDFLTDPANDLGLAYEKVSEISEDVARLLERRHTMRQVAQAIRDTTNCEVVERGPSESLDDIARFDVVFLDYYLDSAETDGELAERIAAEIQHKKDDTRHQQIVLMSSREGVRKMRTSFRQKAGIDGASFAFVAKHDLDETWKVRAHLEMLSRAMPYAGALGEYISAVKDSIESAKQRISTTIDDLDIGDFAYIQRVALHADGHPLGDYLSWLLSAHLTALAFEGTLREQQRRIDSMEFQDGPLSPAEPSLHVANLYHDALFARNLGKLEAHPRAREGTGLEAFPLVQLGDVFLNSDHTSAVVVLSADCDLAFSTVEARMPKHDQAVMLISGIPSSIRTDAPKLGSTQIEGMVSGADVYRIDWYFDTFRTVKLGDLAKHLTELGLDLSNRDRLRPMYALKLQQELGAHLLRVGPPIMPPIARHLQGSIIRKTKEENVEDKLENGEVVAARFGNTLSLRMTPSLVSKLKTACRDLLVDMEGHLATLTPEGDKQAAKAHKEWDAKTTSVRGQIENDGLWTDLLRDVPVPAAGDVKKIKGVIWVARGSGWTFPSQPAIVFAVAEHDEPAASTSSVAEMIA